MKIICSWCNKFLGEKEPFDDKSVSHAKCPDCLNKQERESNPKGLSPQPKTEMEETPAEMAARVHQVFSALAEGVLALAAKRGILDRDFKQTSDDREKRS